MSICLQFPSSLLLSPFSGMEKEREMCYHLKKKKKSMQGRWKVLLYCNTLTMEVQWSMKRSIFLSFYTQFYSPFNQTEGEKKETNHGKPQFWFWMWSRKFFVLIHGGGKSLFWGQMRNSISRSLMSNNKRRTLFSVRDFWRVFFACLACRSPPHHHKRKSSS